MTRKKTATKKKPQLEAFDKYAYYRRSVQAPDHDVLFFRETYKELRSGKAPKTLREDFCGTFSICCEWVKLDPKNSAVGVDLDPEPIAYGREHYLPMLSSEQQKRVQIIEENVLNPKLPKADIVCAMNFSHFIFKERSLMTAYFRNCYETLNSGGILIADCFGGSRCQEANEEETEHKDFSYFWDQDSFDPVTNFATFYIHFKRKGEKKREKVFSYDWRMWSIPELREMMKGAGFKKAHVYWEGTAKNGEGNGVFTRTEKGEECEAWIAYIVGEK